MRVRLVDDPIVVVDISHGKKVIKNPVNVWGTIENPEWAQAFMLSPDGTLGPTGGHGAVGCNLCLGTWITTCDVGPLLIFRGSVLNATRTVDFCPDVHCISRAVGC